MLDHPHGDFVVCYSLFEIRWTESKDMNKVKSCFSYPSSKSLASQTNYNKNEIAMRRAEDCSTRITIFNKVVKFKQDFPI